MSQASLSRDAPADTGLGGLLARLHSVKFGDGARPKIKRRDLAFILSNLSTLLENGVSLPKALGTLSRERSLKKYAPLLESIRRRIEAGDPFSSALADFPETFDDLMVNQVLVGERSGTVADALAQITARLEQGNQLRSKIIKRLSYPTIVIAAGAGVVAFMLLFIVPTFEDTYEKARIPLPLATRFLIATGDALSTYGWVIPTVIVAAVLAFRRTRRNPLLASSTDGAVLRLPIVGEWLRDVAVLQFVEVLGTMLESGFKLVDALGVSINSVGNRAVRRGVEELQGAIIRGERLSHELERHGEMFPPLVSQLVIVGEHTGNLPKATQHIRRHLRREIERKVEIAVGAIEPCLTIGMAVAIGAILLAIYMPMFGMVDTIDAGM